MPITVTSEKKQVNITQSSLELDTTILGLKCWNKSNIIGKVIQVNKKKNEFT